MPSISRAIVYPMSTNLSCFVWNMRGLNSQARRNAVREFLVQHRAMVVCLQETKLSSICTTLASEILGTMFDYEFVPAANVSGGILLAWHRDHWVVSGTLRGPEGSLLTLGEPVRVWDDGSMVDHTDRNVMMRRPSS